VLALETWTGIGAFTGDRSCRPCANSLLRRSELLAAASDSVYSVPAYYQARKGGREKTHPTSSSQGNCRFLAIISFGILGISIFVCTTISLSLFAGIVPVLLEEPAPKEEVEALGVGFEAEMVFGSRAAMIAFLRLSAAVSTPSTLASTFALTIALSVSHRYHGWERHKLTARDWGTNPFGRKKKQRVHRRHPTSAERR
jgi:hypothetical protein